MPKVTGPMFSLNASGTFARLITYEKRGNETRTRALPGAKPPLSPLQTIYVTKLRNLATAWQAQTPTTQAAWNTAASNINTTGYKLWWREWFIQNIQPPDTPTLP